MARPSLPIYSVRYEYESANGAVRARIEGPEEVTVPAGTFTCLVCVDEREDKGRRWTDKRWLAPRVGTAKTLLHADQDYTISLVRWEGPREVKPPRGTDVVSTFDVGDLLGSHELKGGIEYSDLHYSYQSFYTGGYPSANLNAPYPPMDNPPTHRADRLLFAWKFFSTKSISSSPKCFA